ncbi:MAG: hypothetical protein KKD31_04160 [Bacteroidetes bacterium]|nr:hypothetical protein [Bacteroidota bacterium]
MKSPILYVLLVFSVESTEVLALLRTDDGVCVETQKAGPLYREVTICDQWHQL